VKKLISKKATHIHLEYSELLADARELNELSNVVSTNTTITSVMVNHFHFKRQTSDRLFGALQYNKSITFLDLSMTQLNDESLLSFPKLMKNETLRTLVLQHNAIGDTGMLYLTDALSSNTTLTALDISFNPYKAIGAAHLTSCLSTSKTLSSLSLRGNYAFDSLPNLASLIEWCAFLKELDVSGPLRDNSVLTPTACVVLGTLQQLHRWGRSYAYTNINCGFITEDEDKALRSILNKAPLEDVLMLNAHSPYLTEFLKGSLSVISINISKGTLNTIPVHIFSDQIVGLRSLSLDSNRITGKLPSQLSRLTNLTFLDLHDNEIFEIPSSISALKQLVTFDLRWNKIRKTGLPPCLFLMSSLRSLRLQSNPIDALPIDLYTIPNTLDIHVQATLLPKSLQIILFARHQQLNTLAIPHFQLKAMPMELGMLTALQTLDLSYNSLVALPIEIGNLTQLCRLDVRHNELKNLPWTVGHLPELKELLLEGNPLSELPTEVFKQDTALIKAFLSSLRTGEVSCTRIKVLVVGEENVGKTALIECLQEFNAGGKQHKSKAPKTLSTDGVSIRSLTVDSTLRFSVWDFAGQQVYYNSHHFFITNNSLFIVVFNLAEANPFDRVSYWLQVSLNYCFFY